MDVRLFVASLPSEAKLAFWSRLSHELTVIARDTYEPGTENVKDPSRLRRVNELQHILTGVIVALIEDRKPTISDGDLVGFFADPRADTELGNLLQFCLSRVVTRLQTRQGGQESI